MTVTNLAILGSTGSIGCSTLDVVARHPDKYRVTALAAQRRDDLLFEQCVRFKPRFAVLVDEQAAERLLQKIAEANLSTQVLCGMEALEQVASLPEVDAVMAAIVGAAGLRPTLAAARAGKKILLANKETLVMAGAVFMDAVRASGSVLLPIDSEHNAIFQSLPHHFSGDLGVAGVSKILLTASGGPFRNTPQADLLNVTPEQACAHPNWSMGKKISVDSATMMNKGLEVIEAHWLFNAPVEIIQVVVHPQSVIHSLVQYVDGSVIAQMGNPDMRTPIAYALAYPDRIASGVEPLDLFKVATLDFVAPDFARFPCLALAYQALRVGGTASAVLNAANEVAVDAFLNRKISFLAIPRLIEDVLAALPVGAVDTLDDVLNADEAARVVALEWVRSLDGTTSQSTKPASGQVAGYVPSPIPLPHPTVSQS
jgi:1-deoxy-D-xylulose-5-phosphate reductoisomerase